MFAAALALAALLPTGPSAAADFPRGQAVERVVVADTPSQSYALYLPSAYTPEKLWPVLFMLDARGNALVPLERFRAAAERFGWILVSSYNSRSDTSHDPNSPAMTTRVWSSRPSALRSMSRLATALSRVRARVGSVPAA